MSLNSDSKSKRSFKSISPNPSSSSINSGDGKSSNKKKKTAQKTLGMAWGASSRHAFRNSPFTDFGSYMAVKNQKLHEQFDAAASSSSNSASTSGKSIFSGVSIFVDGYTVPSSQELRGYMLKAFSRGRPVVKPAWLLDSVAASKLLSWIPYQLDQLAPENNNQPKLSAFFTPKTSGVSEVGDLPSQVMPENDACVEGADRCSLELDDLQENVCKVMSEEPDFSVESYCEVKGVEYHSLLDGRGSDFKQKSNTSQVSVSLCSNSLEKHNVREASSSRTVLPPNQRHSTLSDPNFVENYFKNSRLHFIGTWRNRYRKRFRGLSDGLSYKSTSLNTAAVNEKNAIVHMDMDCFFVSVVIRNHPELLEKPVAVCHSDNPRGTAEISSANYPARDHGVKAGMFVKDAKARCPQLVIVPYDFGAYETVADQFYDILHKHCTKVQAVSCDEAFLDMSDSEVRDPQLLASVIRKEILDTTGCTASAGIAGNMLMARLATKTAKPDGQCYIPFEEIDNYLHTLPVKALPGIGHVLEAKLKQKQVRTCGQLRLISKESLQKDFGLKTGEMLWNFSRGIDTRLVGLIQESKSIGAEVNWGVRFRNLNDTLHFLMHLCKEVALRLQGCGVHGRAFTLKIKKKRSDAGEPVKYMGCGDCENLSHTITIPMATDDEDVIERLATQLLGHFHIVTGLRWIPFDKVSKLEGADDSKLVHKRNSILPWLVSTSEKSSGRKQIGGLSNLGDADRWRPSDGEVSGQPSVTRSSGTGVSLTTSLPPLQDLDMSVLESLPPQVISEIDEMYGGKLSGFIFEKNGTTLNTNIAATSHTSEGVPIEKTNFIPAAHLVEINTIVADSKEMQRHEQAPTTQAVPPSFSTDNLLPSSLSQVDCSVLQQLPDELRKDIIELLPQHREPAFPKGSSSNVIDKQTESADTELNDLWGGSPPKWVEMFERNSCSTLNNFAKIHRSGSGDCLSSLLQRMVSGLFLPIGEAAGMSDDAVGLLCELFKQYVDLKIATDMEEIYLCICLLKRLTGMSECFLQVYDIVLPHLQASMDEKYGGTLRIPCGTSWMRN
ncbi:hypothetical protein OROHE_024484 [Orobanche hederae]